MSGAPAEHVEHWKPPKIVESTLKYMTVTFMKSPSLYTNNKRDALQQLEFIHSMIPVIEWQTWVNAEPAKWYLSLNMNSSKSTSPSVKTDLAVTCHSKTFKSIDTAELNYQFQVVLSTSRKNRVIYFIESRLKKMKNTSFHLKSPFCSQDI